MGKNILYINYILQYGHINFDCIHINALLEQGFWVEAILHQSIAKELSTIQHPRLHFTKLPRCLSKSNASPLINRILYILTLLYIRIKFAHKKYDGIILSSFEEISLALFPPYRGMHLICHGNTNTLNNTIKRWGVRRLARHNRFLVFNERMKEPFRSIGINNVDVISHGCVAPFKDKGNSFLPFNKDKFDLVAYHPSNKVEPKLINIIENDTCLTEFLQRERILLILRGKECHHLASPNIHVITERIPTDQYRNLFLSANVILMAYPLEFKYQVSGISFECVANKKNVLIYKNPALSYCKAFYAYNPEFDDATSLKERLLYLKQHPEPQCIATPESLTPDYKAILE